VSAVHHEILINVTRMFESFLHARFVISLNVTRRMRSGSPSFFFFFFFLPFRAVVAQLLRQVCGDSLPFAVWVRSQIDGIGRQRQLLQPNEDFLLPRPTSC